MRQYEIKEPLGNDVLAKLLDLLNLAGELLGKGFFERLAEQTKSIISKGDPGKCIQAYTP